jgi:subtilase family serine protease
LSPAQVRHAYGFDQISFNGTPGDGSGTTIAIVDAYDDPTIAGDLHQFDLQFGLPDPTFSKVNQNGGSSMPAADSGWAQEISLDVEWAHAMAPKANILFVEASDSSDANLFGAVDYAARQPGVVAVSMSWGGGEFSSEASYDAHFLTPSGHAGVAFIASSGDSGAPVSYPAASPNVLSVGGTTLNLGSGSSYLSESGWSGSGGGGSAYEAQPAYQKGVVTQSSTRRTNPDVSYDADPSTGFAVYDSYGSTAPWEQIGGTSAGAPQWAALVAIADQGRALQGLGSLDSSTQLLPMLYALPAGDFHDVTGGTSTGNPYYTAGAGYDLVTGRGSPLANLVVSGLVGGAAAAPSATHFQVSAPTTETAGTPFTFTVTALDANNNVVTNYAGTAHFTNTDPQATLPANATLTNGTGTFTATFGTAGAESLTATDASATAVTGTETGITVNPGAPTHLAFGQQPTNTAVGAAISPAVTVRLLDQYNNLVTTDNTDQVTVALGANPGGVTLGGTVTMTVSGGVATFGNLSLNTAGTGYTLAASSGILAGATSAAFNVTATATPSTTLIEGFGGGSTWYIVGGYSATAYLSTAAAHDGTYGLDDTNGTDWIYRNDAAAQVRQGQSVSVWLRFANVADGRAYFGFGASP